MMDRSRWIRIHPSAESVDDRESIDHNHFRYVPTLKPGSMISSTDPAVDHRTDRRYLDHDEGHRRTDNRNPPGSGRANRWRSHELITLIASENMEPNMVQFDPGIDTR